MSKLILLIQKKALQLYRFKLTTIKNDWQTLRRSKRPKRAKNSTVPAPTRKQTLTLMDLWGKKKDKSDQTKEATGADTDEP